MCIQVEARVELEASCNRVEKLLIATPHGGRDVIPITVASYAKSGLSI